MKARFLFAAFPAAIVLVIGLAFADGLSREPIAAPPARMDGIYASGHDRNPGENADAVYNASSVTRRDLETMAGRFGSGARESHVAPPPPKPAVVPVPAGATTKPGILYVGSYTTADGTVAYVFKEQYGSSVFPLVVGGSNGEGSNGWILRSVAEGKAILSRNGQTTETELK